MLGAKNKLRNNEDNRHSSSQSRILNGRFHVWQNLWSRLKLHHNIILVLQIPSRMSCCGYCYGGDAKFACGKCHKRRYCSKDCQKEDWRCGHKHWCGVAGELGFDFEIRKSSDERGLGVFALRSFNKNEKIMAERCVMYCKEGCDLPIDLSPPFAKFRVERAIMQLAPSDRNWVDEKYSQNAIGFSDSDQPDVKSGLFINMSRCNHDCIGNAYICSVSMHKVQLLIASRPISIGEEVTFPYLDTRVHKDRQAMFHLKWEFSCWCAVCSGQDHIQNRLLQQKGDLNKQFQQRQREGKHQLAVDTAKQLLLLYDATNTSAAEYAITYYDLFAITVARRSTLEDAKRYIALAYETACAMYSGCKDINVEPRAMFKKYMGNPALHCNYSVLDQAESKQQGI